MHNKLSVFPAIILALLLVTVSCNKNPFGYEQDVYNGSTVPLSAGSGYNFDLVSRTATSEKDADFYFYQRGLEYYIGSGWSSSGDGPATQCVANLHKPLSEFSNVHYPPQVQ
jgi:hypothetical protein